ncbi:hypothetical protein L7F22_051056 [Adiantum nelumboides]|nr:hypothetical protein [Adiantum nelumboides]
MSELPDENPTADQIKAFKDWNQEARKVMYWLSVSVQDTMIGHIQDATSPKQAWDRLVSFDTTNTKARKIQLKTELNTVKKENLSINADGLYVEEYKKNGKLIAQGKKVGECLLLMYTPQQNGVAELKNRHIAEVARTLMAEKNVPHCYWAEVVSTAVYIMNKTPTAAVHDVTPEKNFSGKKPDLRHFKVSGCIAYVHVPDELRTKLDPKTEKCIFIGYSLEQKGYKCYNPITRHVRVIRDVVFYEMASWYASCYANLEHDIATDVTNKVVIENATTLSHVM